MRIAAAITAAVLALAAAGCSDDENGTQGTETQQTGTAPQDQSADPEEKGPSGGGQVAPDATSPAE